MPNYWESLNHLHLHHAQKKTQEKIQKHWCTHHILLHIPLLQFLILLSIFTSVWLQYAFPKNVLIIHCRIENGKIGMRDGTKAGMSFVQGQARWRMQLQSTAEGRKIIGACRGEFDSWVGYTSHSHCRLVGSWERLYRCMRIEVHMRWGLHRANNNLRGQLGWGKDGWCKGLHIILNTSTWKALPKW